jgi:hypothetical protein
MLRGRLGWNAKPAGIERREIERALQLWPQSLELVFLKYKEAL